MALGLGEGFETSMDGVTKKINASVPTTINGSYQVEGIVNGLSTVMGSQSSNSTINLVLDGKTLATVLFDPLNGVAKQKGVSFA